jgi:hypothetical protein
MHLSRPHRVRCATALLLVPLAACGAGAGGPGGAPGFDAPPTPDAPRPVRTIRGIVDSMVLPRFSNDAVSFDLDDDGRRDNRLSGMMAALTSALGAYAYDPGATLDRAVARGDVLQLVEYTRFEGTPAPMTFTTLQGTAPMPPPCAGDGTCGHHLDDDGTFAVVDVARPAAIAGMDDDQGGFTAGPGELTWSITLFGRTPAVLPLFGVHARGHARMQRDAIYDGVLGGAIREADVHAILIPAFARGMNEILAEDCGTTCACASGSVSVGLRAMFDADGNCSISTDEVATNALWSQLFEPDVRIGGQAGVSIGVQFTAVPAQFTP